jgi:hypothetical protein
MLVVGTQVHSLDINGTWRYIATMLQRVNGCEKLESVCV